MQKSIIMTLAALALAAGLAWGEERSPQAGNLGLIFWDAAYSQTDSVEGGYYLKTGLSYFLKDWCILNASYNTNILVEPFSDRLLSAELLLGVFKGETVTLAAGPAYIHDLDDPYRPGYIGISVLPMTTWRTQFSADAKFLLTLLPFSLYYHPGDGTYLWAFNFLDIQFYF